MISSMICLDVITLYSSISTHNANITKNIILQYHKQNELLFSFSSISYHIVQSSEPIQCHNSSLSDLTLKQNTFSTSDPRDCVMRGASSLSWYISLKTTRWLWQVPAFSRCVDVLKTSRPHPSVNLIVSYERSFV